MNGVTTWYLWDGDQLLAEYDGSGARTVRYAYAGSFAPVQVAYKNSSGEDVYDVHSDHLDTPRLLTDSSGAVVWREAHEAFGKAVLDPANTVTFNVRFPGQYFDAESGLHDNRFRTFDPSTGRYISADPIGQAGGFNVLSYVESNPLSFTDPLGLLQFKDGVPRDTVRASVRNQYDLIDSVAINMDVAERTVTSTTDTADGRVAKTKHDTGEAIDLRCQDITDEKQDELGKALADALGTEFDVDSEHWKNPARDHIHIEYDPKPGKTSNFRIVNGKN